MKASELRAKSSDELTKELLTLREEQFKLRMQRVTGQLGADASAAAKPARHCSCKNRTH
jgi:ribosomal protein L29